MLKLYKITSSIFFILFYCVVPASAQEMSGDERTACEALLCLSSPTRPGECAPSVDRYFSISKKKWKDTVRARKDFLNKCPSASEPGMPSVDSIANSAR